MRKCFILITIVFISIGLTNAWAANPDCAAGTCQDASWNESIGKFIGCDGKNNYTCTCLGAYGGMSWTTFDCGCASDNECDGGYCNGTSCVACQSCSNCTSTSWAALRTGYESRIEKSCSCSGTCSSSTKYRCAAGYYGSSTNGTSGCTQCPTWTGVYTNSGRTVEARGTSTAGTTAITGCYVAPGTYYDATGQFTLTANCDY